MVGLCFYFKFGRPEAVLRLRRARRQRGQLGGTEQEADDADSKQVEKGVVYEFDAQEKSGPNQQRDQEELHGGCQTGHRQLCPARPRTTPEGQHHIGKKSPTQFTAKSIN